MTTQPCDGRIENGWTETGAPTTGRTETGAPTTGPIDDRSAHDPSADGEAVR